MKIKFKYTCFILLYCCMLYILILYYSNNRLFKFKNNYKDLNIVNQSINVPIKLPIIIWWTRGWTCELGNAVIFEEIEVCGFYKCRITNNKNVYHNNPDVRAFAFYAHDLQMDDFPLPRSKKHLWALYHEETPIPGLFIFYESFMQHFNFTSTFSRFSDLPLTTQFINNYSLLRTQKYLVPIGEKNILQKKNKLASVVYVYSKCFPMSGRDEYVRELMRYIDIDSYGKCLNNRDMPKSLSGQDMDKLGSDEFYRFLARYKFIIAIENAACNDYITEQFWAPLIVGSIPIYFGSPTIRDWMPNNNSAILISDFDSPKQLADFVNQLDKSDQKYNDYLDHKYLKTKPIKNERLKKTLFDRDSNVRDIRYFECALCTKLHQKDTFKKISMAKQSHYDCNKIIRPKMKEKYKCENFWNSYRNNGKCNADLLNSFFIKNKSFTIEKFEEEKTIDINTGRCKL